MLTPINSNISLSNSYRTTNVNDFLSLPTQIPSAPLKRTHDIAFGSSHNENSGNCNGIHFSSRLKKLHNALLATAPENLWSRETPENASANRTQEQGVPLQKQPSEWLPDSMLRYFSSEKQRPPLYGTNPRLATPPTISLPPKESTSLDLDETNFSEATLSAPETEEPSSEFSEDTIPDWLPLEMANALSNRWKNA